MPAIGAFRRSGRAAVVTGAVPGVSPRVLVVDGARTVRESIAWSLRDRFDLRLERDGPSG
jgi:hypothetical protein